MSQTSNAASAAAATTEQKAEATTTTTTATSAAAAAPQTNSKPADWVSRKLDKQVLSREQGEGHGARVRRSIGGYELRNFDPFLMLDEFRVGPPAGFPDHPHRGFETVTYMLPTTKGAFEHEDFVGHRGKIGPGDLQWMTAGKGILHSEMPASKEESHGLQLWVNLAAKNKMIDPAYQELKAADIPKVTQGGVTAIVIAGEAFGTKSKVHTRTPTYYLHFYMQPNSQLHQVIPAEWNSFIYTLSGTIRVGEDSTKAAVAAHTTATLTKGDKSAAASSSGVSVYTGSEAAEFVVLSGQPLNEPVVQHGPFVMNTQAEIMQAMRDYQSGKNGFEKAPGWRSEIGRPITDKYHDDDD